MSGQRRREIIMAANSAVQELVKQKLDAFDQLTPAFVACFPFVQQVHGQRRFSTFPVAQTVYYLHSLWICECKDRLLSIYKNIERYEGAYCLELMRRWQEGMTADVVDFLNRKLDMLPLSDLTRQIHEAKLAGADDGRVRRLMEGRGILLNRGMNLMQICDAIFALPEEQLLNEVRAACQQYGHSPEQIEQQLAQFDEPLYGHVTSQALARRNMEVMNRMGVQVMSRPSDRPGERSQLVLEPTKEPHPFAEQVIVGYVEMTAPWHNNVRAVRFVDFPEHSEEGSM